ncbi:MAG: T9SS type A sorting domain-containing protein [candidate division WOR-3 bacterium]|nr:T9SS type A sorting domain-containing protein [candidate division WOR-3 bacterium]
MLLILTATVVAFGQNYRCTWSVIDRGGSRMSSVSYCDAVSLGQTAVGPIAGADYRAFIGFFGETYGLPGIQEQRPAQQTAQLLTRLEMPSPNPCFDQTVVRYSLRERAQVDVQVFDLAGRCVQTLVHAEQAAGRYAVAFSRHGGVHLSAGVYFVRMRAGAYRAIEKVVIE